MNTPIIVGLVVTLSTSLVLAQEQGSKSKEESSGSAEPRILAATEMQWGEGPPSLPAGAQMVVLDGDPRQKGPFTIRLKIPAGYKILAHTHPVAEHITVISGTVHLGIGEKFAETGSRELKAGDFAVVPPGMPHFASSRSEAVLQIHGEGPFQRQFVDPAEDATKK